MNELCCAFETECARAFGHEAHHEHNLAPVQTSGLICDWWDNWLSWISRRSGAHSVGILVLGTGKWEVFKKKKKTHANIVPSYIVIASWASDRSRHPFTHLLFEPESKNSFSIRIGQNSVREVCREQEKRGAVLIYSLLWDSGSPDWTDGGEAGDTHMLSLFSFHSFTHTRSK